MLIHLVKEARRRADLSQAELARRAGMAQSTVARIESGARTPSTSTLERLVRAAGFDIHSELTEAVDPDTISLLESRLQRTPAERLADAVLMTRFVLHGRAQILARRSGSAAPPNALPPVRS